MNVLQPWVAELPMMQQTVLLTAVRGPDGLPKYHTVKYLLRWYRRCILLSAMDQRVLLTPFNLGGGSFTGPSIILEEHPVEDQNRPWTYFMDKLMDSYLQSLDEVPHHFQLHFMHAAEILGYRHPGIVIQDWWRLKVYQRLVADMHLEIEGPLAMNQRLGDDRESWLARADKATQS